MELSISQLSIPPPWSSILRIHSQSYSLGLTVHVALVLQPFSTESLSLLRRVGISLVTSGWELTLIMDPWPAGKVERDSDEGKYYIVKHVLHFRPLHSFQARETSIFQKRGVGHFCRPHKFKGIWESVFSHTSFQISPSQASECSYFCIQWFFYWIHA